MVERMSTKRTQSWVRSMRSESGVMAVFVSGAMLLTACGGDDTGGVPQQPATGAGTGALAAGTAAPAPAGTGAAIAGRGTTTGTSGTGAAGRSPAAGGAGAPAPVGGTGAAAGASGSPPDVMVAGTGAMAGTGGAGGDMAAAGTGGTTTVPGGFPEESKCLADITEYDKEGPFKYEAKHMGSVKIWVPTVPAGCKVPVVHLANGTGATCSAYQNVLNRFASHGFLTTCYENTNTGAGTQGVMAIDTVFKAFPDLAAKRIGSTGHSQGGQASFIVLELSEMKWGLTDYVYAGLAMEPASGFGSQPAGGSWQSHYAKIKSPMLAFSGTADMLVSQGWVQQGYDALDNGIEAYHWSAVGATHIPTPQPETMQIGVAWWRWKLLNDQKACEWFKKLPDGPDWNVVKEQNVKPCM